MKHEWARVVALTLLDQKISRQAFENPVHITFDIHMKRPMDVDNVMASDKLIIDQLVDYGVLRGDSPTYVKSILVSVEKAKEDYINVEITETDNWFSGKEI